MSRGRSLSVAVLVLSSFIFRRRRERREEEKRLGVTRDVEV